MTSKLKLTCEFPASETTVGAPLDIVVSLEASEKLLTSLTEESSLVMNDVVR